MANASCMAGMAFANAFLGVNHSLAHKLGAFHHIPHGIANALVLTDVMRYNSVEVPTKMGTFPQYQYPHTLARYAEIGRFVGLTGKNDQEVFEKLLEKLEELKKINRILEKEYPEAYRETLVVLDATTGQNALVQAKQFSEAAEITGIVLTKMDELPREVLPLQSIPNLAFR